MCKHGDEVLLEVLMPADLSYTGKSRWAVKGIDACLVPLIKALNNAGIYTANSCCGHNKEDGFILLHDRTELIIKRSK